MLYVIKSVQVAHLSLNDSCISVLTTDYGVDVSVEPTPVKMLICLVVLYFKYLLQSSAYCLDIYFPIITLM